MVTKKFPLVHLIANKRNLGFAAANNQAIRRSLGRHILLLNPDCVLDPGALQNLLWFLGEHPRAGVTGGRLKGDDGALQRSVRNFPTFSSQAAILLKLHHLFPKIDAVSRYLAPDHDYLRPGRVEQVMGAFFAIPRHVMAEVGLLDERFFLWFEEVDYCRRVKAAGYEVYYTPLAEAFHAGGASFCQLLSARKQKIWNKSLSRYMKKHHGFLLWLILQPLLPISFGITWIYDRVSALRKRK